MTNIYIIKNTYNKFVYIGMTKGDIDKVFVKHVYSALWEKDSTNDTLALYKAIKEIGYTKFFVKLLSKASDEEAYDTQQYYIKKYKKIYNEVSNKFTKEELEKLLASKTIREIARDSGKSHSSICRLVHKYKINYTYEPEILVAPELTEEKLYECYVTKGMSCRAIARTYNIKSANTVKQRLLKYNIKK